MNYNPGLHILAEIRTEAASKMKHSDPIRLFFDQKIAEYGLHKLGEVYHEFENGGYTGVVCLTESHIAVHTWPEFGVITFDVFLSNFRKENDETARKIFRDTLLFFESDNYKVEEMKR